MQYKCVKCKRKIKLKLHNYLIGLKDKGNPFLCDECHGIRMWKKKKARKVLGVREVNYFEYVVNESCENLSLWIERIVQDSEKLIDIYKEDSTVMKAFPIKYENDYLYCVNIETNHFVECGVYIKGNTNIQIPINIIKKIRVVYVYDDYVAPDVKEPIYGYKGVYLENGILGDSKYIYEIGIPYEEEKQNPYKSDFQDIYSHFCLRMEDVLFTYGRDYISSPMKSNATVGLKEKRLFRVKAEGHCVQRNQTGWVSNKLTLIEEVTQKEIIDYFSNSLQLMKMIVDYFGEQSESIWEEYIHTEIKPYRQVVDKQEIEKLFFSNCVYRNEYCKYDDNQADRNICRKCDCYSYYQIDLEKEYNYLIARSMILRKEFDESCESYQYLLSCNARREIDALQRLNKWIEK